MGWAGLFPLPLSLEEGGMGVRSPGETLLVGAGSLPAAPLPLWPPSSPGKLPKSGSFGSFCAYLVSRLPHPFKLTSDTLLIKERIHRINFSTLIIERHNPNLFNELIMGHGGILIMKYF